MYLKGFVILVFLVYFIYMSWVPTTQLSRPTLPEPVPPSQPPTHQLTTHNQTFQFITNQRVDWFAPLPAHLSLHQNKFVPLDACDGIANGTHIPAKGKPLYDHLQRDALSPLSLPFHHSADVPLQNKDVFYFRCENHRIASLHMCPPGQVFRHTTCQHVDECFGKKDGTTLADAFNFTTYIECQHGRGEGRTCPPGTFFFVSKCRKDMNLYCKYHTEPKVLDRYTLLVCHQGRAEKHKCPPGYQYFKEAPRCQSAQCDKKPDGTRLPMQRVAVDGLSYSPGYVECRGGRVARNVLCPTEPTNDRLPGQVYDGTRCTASDLCRNVTLVGDAIVPVYEFERDVKNWSNSYKMDQVTGYTCENGRPKRVAMQPGNVITKRFKVASGCYSTASRVAVSGNPYAYFDCASRRTQRCPHDQFFDGTACEPVIKHAHTYRGYGLFRFKPFTFDQWLTPPTLSSEAPVTCVAPESVYLHGYNVCSDPDCAVYPFLTQLRMPVYLPNRKDKCVWDRGKLVKRPTNQSVSFWTQRLSETDDACIPGQKLRSGHFVLDSVLYATCLDAQPFVFCPSSRTAGIKQQGSYYCDVGMVSEIPPNSRVELSGNEVESIAGGGSIDGTPTSVVTTPPDKTVSVETHLYPVEVKYKTRVTHPPEVVLTETGPRFQDRHVFSTELDAFTQLPLTFPMYEMDRAVSGFY